MRAGERERGSRADSVVIRGLGKTFGSVQVLRDVNLDVKKGEAVVIVGSSGSGKSTCLRCINRLEEPTEGHIFVGGHEVTGKGVDLNALRRRIGMVFQSINLYPHKTALGNVTLALRKVAGLSKSEADEKGRRHLELVGLSQKADLYPGNSPAVSNNGLESPVPWRSNRTSSCSTNRPRPSTRNWLAKC